jgi:hypothetical protein
VAHTYGASRNQKTVLDHDFELRFVERAYDACERWYNHELWPLIGTVTGDRHRLLDRDPDVKQRIIQAHEPAIFYSDSSCYLLTCVNPDCALRGWKMLDYASGEYTSVSCAEPPVTGSLLEAASMERLRSDIHHQLRALALEKLEDLAFHCPSCRVQQPLFAIGSITDKWIYVLTEAGQSLSPVWEIYAETEVSGAAHPWDGGQFSKKFVPYDGALPLTPKLVRETLHFFLSPVRLGPKALDMLRKSPRDQSDWDSRIRKADPDTNRVPVYPKLQPWCATVKRRFTRDQLPTRFEYVPLVDPFAWAETANEFDFVPVLDAQRELAANPSEQAKYFIASTLKEAIYPAKAEPDKNGKAEPRKIDPFEIEERLIPAPDYKTAMNAAEAWVLRYGDITEHMAKSVNYAYCRVFFSALFSPGHRIVEAACQEHPEDPDFLQMGLLHWHILLKNALQCPAGKEFVKALMFNDEATASIPKANVIKGEGLRRKSKYFQKYKNAVPGQIFASLMPLLVAESDQPIKLSEYFEEATGEGYFFGDDEAEFLEKPFDVAIEHLEEHFHHLMHEFAKGKIPSESPRACWRYQGAIGRGKDMLTIWALFVRWRRYNQSKHDYVGKWERFDAIRGIAFELPTGGAKLAADWYKEFLEGRLNELKFMGGGEILAADAALATKAERSIRLFGKVSRLMEGPVGLITAVLDLLSETEQALDAADAGNTGAAIGHGVEAAGALLAIAPCVAYSVALVTGAEAVAWAGPVGLAAAALMACGAVVVACLSTTDVALFASHCFLGNRYGEGKWDDKTGKRWMADHPWPWLRYEEKGSSESSNRFLRQRAALLRIFCHYEIVVGPAQFAGGDIFIKGWIPNGAIFQIEVTVKPIWESYPSKTYQANILPSTEKCEWIGERPADSIVTFNRSSEGKLQSIHVSAIPPFAKTNLAAKFRTRLQLDATGEFPIPGRNWLEKSTSDQGIASSTETE